MLSRNTENALKVTLTKKLEEWWDQNAMEAGDLPYVGDNLFEIMATAALAVLIGIADTQDYLYQEDMFKPDEED